MDMKTDTQLRRWSPKVAGQRIRTLYETDARGIVDEELIDDVGYALYARCDDIVEVTTARNGNVKCQGCGTIIQRRGGVEEALACAACDWRTVWGEYQRSYNRKGLLAGIKGAPTIGIFDAFVKRWPGCRTPRDKIILIDRLIHEFHADALNNDTRPSACNVIKGNATEVIALLNSLAYGDESTSGLCASREQWYERLRASRFST
jgi:hypothetical protein